MKKFEALSEPMKIAYITAASVILAAIIGGLFLLFNTLLGNSAHSQLPTPTASSASPTLIPPSSSSATTITSTAPYGGTLVLDDTLAGNSSHGWEEYSTADSQHGNACWFDAGTYHAYQAKPSIYNFNYCKARRTDFRKFAFQVQMNIVQGDCGGILVDGDMGNVTDPQFYYHFVVCQDGQYYFIDTLMTGAPLASGNSSAIKTGLNQLNFIAIVAKPDSGEFDLYINEVFLTSVYDKKHTHGFIGVGAFDLNDQTTTEVTCRNAKVWSL